MSRLLRTVFLGLTGYLLAGGCMDATGTGGFSVLQNIGLGLGVLNPLTLLTGS